jgi:hypothetical protein
MPKLTGCSKSSSKMEVFGINSYIQKKNVKQPKFVTQGTRKRAS